VTAPSSASPAFASVALPLVLIASRRRRHRSPDERRLIEVDVQELFSDIYNQPAPVLIAPLDEDDEPPLKRHRSPPPPAKRPRRCSEEVENADPEYHARQLEEPQEQVRLAEETPSASPPLGCAAAAGGFDFQHVFQHLVPSLES